jgi:inosine-uridine nucleoside N-ribohydrolase
VQLSGLLNSTADSYSPLGGRELVAAKVDELVVMGGEYPSGHEFNFWGSNASLSAHVVHNWPGAITFLGLEVGLEVMTGVPLMEVGPANDPVRAAYIYYTYLKARFSWDPLTVLYAIDGLGERFVYGNADGYNGVYANGSNEWVQDAAITNQHWLKLKVDNVTIVNDVDKLFLAGARRAASKAQTPADASGELRPHEEL